MSGGMKRSYEKVGVVVDYHAFEVRGGLISYYFLVYHDIFE